MQYDFTLAANGAQFIDVKGTFFRYKNGTGKIRVRNSKGGYIDLIPGQGVNGLNFSSLSITDLTGAPNSGYLLAGDYEFLDSTITGTVAVSALPAIAGTVAVSALPAIAGTVAVSALPAIAGIVAVSALPAITGTVAVSALPAVIVPSYGNAGGAFQGSALNGWTLCTAATNPNGMIIHNLEFSGVSPSVVSFTLLAKVATAPTMWLDGDIINMFTMNGLGNFSSQREIRIPAGRHVSIWASVAETVVLKKLLATLL